MEIGQEKSSGWVEEAEAVLELCRRGVTGKGGVDNGLYIVTASLRTRKGCFIVAAAAIVEAVPAA